MAKAEHYLRLGAFSGDTVAQRNLGLLLLEADQPVEGAEQLQAAAAAGDGPAAASLQQLHREADAQGADARCGTRQH